MRIDGAAGELFPRTDHYGARRPRRLMARHVVLIPLVFVPLLGGCAGSGSGGPSLGSSSDTFDQKWGVSSSQRVVVAGPIPKGGGYYKLGKPYQIGGRWYVPRHEPYYDRTGVGSWYGKQFHGRKTANGEIFDMDALTAAHPTLPMPSYAYVTNMRNGRTILVRINDRGPYVADREIDLSRASARALGYEQGGLGKVRVRWAGHAPLSGHDRREQEFLRNQPWNGGPVAQYDRPARSYDDRDYDAPTGRQRYAQDHNRASDVTYDQRYAAEPQEQYSQRIYASDQRAGERQGRIADVYEPPQRQPVYDELRMAQAPRRAAEIETSSYDRPAEPDLSPVQEPPAQVEEMWSPFAHREAVKGSRRR
jgi:rare lipoprotein A (peptidoglycan hydrolase)